MILETARLILKPYEKAFADDIFQVVKRKEIADTMIMIPHPYPREVVDEWIDYLQQSFEEGSAYEFAVFLKENNRYIGNCVSPKSNNAYNLVGISDTINVSINGGAFIMSTNKPIIVPVHLDPLPIEFPSGSSSRQTVEPTCVIKTATAEISFFNGVDAHLVQTVLKGLVLE